MVKKRDSKKGVQKKRTQKQGPILLAAKARHRKKILDYLSGWEHDFPNRKTMAKIAGTTIKTLAIHFSPEEFIEIEDEGFRLRQKNSASPRAMVYDAMLKTALDSSVAAQREFLDRTEGKVIDKIEHKIDGDSMRAILSALPPEYAEAVKKKLMQDKENK